MLARFAALNCDHTWLEDLIIGATDAIEDAFFVCLFYTSGAIIHLRRNNRLEPKIFHAWFFGYTTAHYGYIFYSAMPL